MLFSAQPSQAQALKGYSNYSSGHAIGSGVATFRLSNEAPSDSAAAPKSDGVVPCADEDHGRLLAENEENTSVATRAAEGLTAWIIAKTGWTVGGVPAIRFVPPEELVKRYTGGKSTAPHIGALYSHKDDTIYLPDGWNPDNLRDRSALLHELVHHLQMANNVKAACRAEYEWDAYRLQIAWLREKGIEDPLKFLGINLMAIYVFSCCPEY